MQSLNSPHHSMGPSMSPGPYMPPGMGGMSSGAMAQCMGGGGMTPTGPRDFFPEQDSPRGRGSVPMDTKNYR
jgi:hypothetical protein